MRRLFTLSILCVALAAGLYIQRVEVAEWYRSATAPELPEAVEYEEITQTGAIPSSTPRSLRLEESDPESDEGESRDLEEVLDEQEDPTVNEELPSASAEATADRQDDNVAGEVEEPVDEPVEEQSALPVSMNLAVPFTSQAPQGNWDEPYQEACEEASVYMVHAYFTGVDEGKIPSDTADQDLLKIVEFEMELYGFYKDTTAEQTGMFAELMYGHTYQILTNPTVEDIQRKLVQGHPIIVPAAGRLLGNPYFTAPGPLYHMLVIRGYTDDGQFIVNDPGTSRGEAYLYDFDTVMNAMHDWNDGGEITEGNKVVLVLSP